MLGRTVIELNGRYEMGRVRGRERFAMLISLKFSSILYSKLKYISWKYYAVLHIDKHHNFALLLINESCHQRKYIFQIKPTKILYVQNLRE